MADKELLARVDKLQIKSFEDIQKNFVFPREITSEYQKKVYLTETILSKYHTLATGMRTKAGMVNAVTKNSGRLLTQRRIRSRNIGSNLVHKKLTTPDIGRMFTFMYDPKHKKTLPYYDRLPLCIPIDINPTGFTAINFHHVMPVLRFQLINELERFQMLTDLRTRFKITYNIIKASKKFRLAMPVVRSYLYSHLVSPIMLVPSTDWHLMLALPAPQMIGKHEVQVWQSNKQAALRI